jgi:cytoskeletal protein CcmA (bactofilin family)
MFSSSKTLLDVSTSKTSKIDTIIGPSTAIQGTLSATGSIRVDGKYNGDVVTEMDVIVGETGVVSGNITALNITISGMVIGNMKCSNLMEILPTGQLVGDIDAKNISINTGAIFKGKCLMATKEDNIVTQDSSIPLSESN